METLIPVRIQDCHWDEFTHDGIPHRVEGQCDTSICGAVCCKVMNWKGVVGEQCEFLDDDLKCMFHKQDIHCKPLSCLLWPRKSVDIKVTNEFAERYGFTERCHLKVVEV